MARWVAVFLGVLLIVSNLGWFWLVLDMAVTKKYTQIEDYELRARAEVLEKVCDRYVSGLPRAEAWQLLEEVVPGYEVYEKEGRLNTIWLSFTLTPQGHVAKVGACEA